MQTVFVTTHFQINVWLPLRRRTPARHTLIDLDHIIFILAHQEGY